VGSIDALVGDHWDLLVLFCLVVVIGVVSLLRSFGRRRQVTLREDLFSTLEARGLGTGESLEQLLDRSVATYLEALDESRPAGR
jgi:thioesterase domain-containing protein